MEVLVTFSPVSTPDDVGRPTRCAGRSPIRWSALGAIGSTLVVASPALAHGYVSAPPSRQALCASGAVAGLRSDPVRAAERRGTQGPEVVRRRGFAVLRAERQQPQLAGPRGRQERDLHLGDDRPAPDQQLGVLHRRQARSPRSTAATQQPDAVVTHKVDLSAFPGRQTVLAVWNIGDTANAFYSCVDLNCRRRRRGGEPFHAGHRHPRRRPPPKPPTARRRTSRPRPAGKRRPGRRASPTRSATR